MNNEAVRHSRRNKGLSEKYSKLLNFLNFMLLYFMAMFGMDTVRNIFGFASRNHFLNLLGAEAQTVSVNDSILLNLLFYTNQPNNFSIPLSTIVNQSNATFAGIQNYDGSPVSTNFYFMRSTYPISGGGYNVAINGTLAFLSGITTLNIIDISNLGLPRLLGSYPATVNDIAFNGSLAFLASTQGLQILDVSNPGSPQLKGSYPGYMSSVALQNNVAYLFQYTIGLKIIDVSNTAAPKLLGNYTVPAKSSTGGVAVSGTTVFLGQWNDQLYIVDASNSTSPKLLTTYTNSASEIYDIVLQNTLLYVVGSDYGTLILNVSNPNLPVLVSTYDYLTLESPSKISLYGNFAYIAGSSGLKVVDFSIPSNPKLKATYKIEGLIGGIAVSGNNTFFVGDSVNGLTIFDLSSFSISKNPSTQDHGIDFLNLFYVANSMTFTMPFQLIISEQVSAKNNKASASVSISNYGALFETSFYPQDLFRYSGVVAFLEFTPSTSSTIPSWIQIQPSTYITSKYQLPNSFRVVSSGNLVFVADLVAGLQIVDVSNSALPKLVASDSFYSLSGAIDVLVSNSWLYLLSAGFLKIFDITIPSKPYMTGSYFTGSGYSMTLSGELIFIVCDGSGLKIVNITNSSSPSLVSFLPLSGYSYSVSVSGSLAFVNSVGLKIINITNPALPTLIGNYKGCASPYVRGSLVFASCGGDGLQVLDVSIPSSPQLKVSYNSMAYSSVSSGNLLFVATGTGLQVFDISNPLVPKSKIIYDTIGLCYDVSVSGTMVFLTCGGHGLNIIDFSQLYYTLSGTPTAAVAGNYNFQITATNDLGISSLPSAYSLRVEGAPVINGAMNPQVAFIGQLFNTLVPQGIFVDPNGDALTFSAKLAGGGNLPAWLQFSPTGVFLGTPGSLDVGSMTVQVTAHDGNGGVTSINVVFTVSHLPVVAQAIQNQLANIGQNFSFTFSNTTFVEPDGDAMTYGAQQSNGLPLPSWLSFNASTQTFTGLPTNVSQTSVSISATEIHGGVTSTYFNIIAEHFPQAIQSVPNQLIGLGISYFYALPNELFVDSDGNPMTYSILNAPVWLSFSAFALQLSGIPSGNPTVIPIQIVATDSYGGQGSLSFNLTLDYFPTVNPNYHLSQVINVGKPWNFTLPSDLFTIADHSPLSLNVSANGQALPAWMSFHNNTLLGNATAPMQVNMIVTASNANGASTSTSFTVIVDSFPVVTSMQMPQLVSPIGQAFTYQLPPNLFDYSGNGVLSYTAQQVLNNSTALQALPNWLNFNPTRLLLSGTPAITDAGNLTVRVTATDIVGGYAHADFRLFVNRPPVLAVSTINIPVVKVLEPFKISFGNFFTDPDGGQITMNVTMQDGTALPYWVKFDSKSALLSGTAGREQVSAANPSNYMMTVIANDGLSSTSQNFQLTVTGLSEAAYLTNILKYCGYGLSALSFLFAVYKQRDRIWKYVGKCFYSVPPVGFVIGENVTYRFSSSVISCHVLPSYGLEISFNDFFMADLKYYAKDKIIQGTVSLPDRGEFKVIARHKLGVRSREFTLHIDTEEELKKQGIAIYRTPDTKASENKNTFFGSQNVVNPVSEDLNNIEMGEIITDQHNVSRSQLGESQQGLPLNQLDRQKTYKDK